MTSQFEVIWNTKVKGNQKSGNGILNILMEISIQRPSKASNLNGNLQLFKSCKRKRKGKHTKLLKAKYVLSLKSLDSILGPPPK